MTYTYAYCVGDRDDTLNDRHEGPACTMDCARRFFLFLVVCFFAIAVAVNEDLYQILGVTKAASTKEIKSAYRKKALATHPDKNKGVPPEEAAYAFHKVVHAFEVLSDGKLRQSYDITGDASRGHHEQSGGGSGQQQWRGFQFREQDFFWYDDGDGFQQPIKNSFEVKDAMSRVMHIVSFEQLKTIMLDDNDKLERNLLMVFVTPLAVETICDEHLLFPYPFAGMSTQGIWWEDLMQTVKIRYHRENELTKVFGIPHGDNLHAPIVVFAKRGQTLDAITIATLARIQTRNRQEFEDWTWRRLVVHVWFVNQHTHAVEIFWIDNGSAEMTLTVKPGGRASRVTMLSHEWWVRDIRVDSLSNSPRRNSLTKNSLLGIWKIVSDKDGQEIVIKSKACVDMSGHCEWWEATMGECTNNPIFMRSQCRKTCKFCVDDDHQNGNETPRERMHPFSQDDEPGTPLACDNPEGEKRDGR